MKRFFRLVLLGAVGAVAQFNSAFQGIVMDATGALVPEARVTATNIETGVSRSVATSGEGFYRILSLGPGRYRMVVEKAGFSEAIQEPVTLTTGSVLRLDFSLQVATEAQRVTITAEAPVVTTEQGNISGIVNQAELKSTPLNGNNVFNLLAFQPGIIGRSRSEASGGGGRSGNDPFAGEAGPAIYANGQRQEHNGFTMDGSSINSSVSPGFTNLTPTAEAIQEVRVVVNNVSAVEGRNAGAQVEVITKSGTNEFHGAVFEQHQNNALSSRGVFDPSVAAFRKNQFGAHIGGPLVQNRTFFFSSYEGLRQSGSRGVVSTVETREFRDFVVRTRPNSIAAQVLTQFEPAAYATSNVRDLGSPRTGVNTLGPADGIMDVGGANYIPKRAHGGDQFQIRIDHELRPGKDRLYGNYYVNQTYSLDGNVRPLLNRPFRERSQFAGINYTHTPSAPPC